MKKVLIAAPISILFRNTLVERGFEFLDFNQLEMLDGKGKNGIEGIVTSNKLNLDATRIATFPDLKWIARLGSGMEIIDTSYCDSKGIRYFSSPSGIANSVAEHVVGMLLSLLHNIQRSFSQIQHAQWLREENRGVELEDQIIGIVGYGHTGQALVEKLKVFTKHILVYDKFKSDFEIEGVREVSLEELQKESDIISFHVPLNEDTKWYYDDSFMNSMSKSHILLNASRGEVAKTSTIINGLKSGKIKGACLDVLEEEKNIQQVLHQEPNAIQELLNQHVILTPHIAGYSLNAIDKMSAELLQQLNAIL